jgi:hypothetical protein
MLNASVELLEKQSSIVAVVDRDTKGNTGSPNIFDSITRKIDKAKLFVCDLSIVTKPGMPNPNVLIELGYAIKTLGWDRIVCLFNKESGKIEDLPFNINHNRITPYQYEKMEVNEIARVADILFRTIQSLHKNGTFFSAVEDYVKGKIDHIILKILKNLDSILNPIQENSTKKRNLTEALGLDDATIKDNLTKSVFLGFYFVQSYANLKPLLEKLLDRVFLSECFDDQAKEVIISLIHWIDYWDDLVSQRFHPQLFNIKSMSDFRIIDMHKENSDNPRGSYLLTKSLSESSEVMVRGGILRKYTLEYAKSYLMINEKYITSVSTIIREFMNITNTWLDITGNEFVLDPHSYKLE